jgi:glucokinase-like ROK family protein
MGFEPGTPPPADQVETLVLLLDLIRSGAARTRPDLVRLTGFGRARVEQRLDHLIGSGLVSEGELGSSTGGRAPRLLRFVAERGYLLIAELGAHTLSAGIARLDGTIIASVRETADVAEGPGPIMDQICSIFDQLVDEWDDGSASLWGIGIGVPGSVQYLTGTLVAPPIMPGWDGYSIRHYMSDRYRVPVWVDNDVNLMALGELRAGVASGHRDIVYVKVGSGIGAGVTSRGKLHRGAQGVAGDIGHIEAETNSGAQCRCGNTGCLEAIAGGAAMATAAESLAIEPGYLHSRLIAHGSIDLSHLATAIERKDPIAVSLANRSAQLVGSVLSGVVNFHNPSLIILGGTIANSSDDYLDTVREIVLRRALPLATRDLAIVRSPLVSHRAGMLGAAFMVIDELLSPERIAQWIAYASPAGRPEIANEVDSTTLAALRT